MANLVLIRETPVADKDLREWIDEIVKIKGHSEHYNLLANVPTPMPLIADAEVRKGVTKVSKR